MQLPCLQFGKYLHVHSVYAIMCGVLEMWCEKWASPTFLRIRPSRYIVVTRQVSSESWPEFVSEFLSAALPGSVVKLFA